MTEDSITIFSTKQDGERAYEYKDLTQISISYELDLNKYMIAREVYTVLDWLGDVGGLTEMLSRIGGLIFVLIGGNGLEFLLYSHMFKVQDTKKAS